MGTAIDEVCDEHCDFRNPEKKKDQLSLAQKVGINFGLRTGPVPTTPGGWGLRNPEPKGPGQRSDCLSQTRTAPAGRKWGIIVILLTIP